MKFSWKWFTITVIICLFIGGTLLLMIDPELRCERTAMVAPGSPPAEPIMTTCNYADWLGLNQYIGSSRRMMPDGNATATLYILNVVLISIALSIWAGLWAARDSSRNKK